MKRIANGACDGYPVRPGSEGLLCEAVTQVVGCRLPNWREQSKSLIPIEFSVGGRTDIGKRLFLRRTPGFPRRWHHSASRCATHTLSPMTFVPCQPPILLAFHFLPRLALKIRKAPFVRAGLFHAEVPRFSERCSLYAER